MKRVLIRLEENDNNISKTAKEFTFTERICNDGQKDVICRTVVG